MTEEDDFDFTEELSDDEEEINRNKLTLNDFFNDMILFNRQLQDKNIIKPKFNYGDLNVTNYLLWLVLGKLTMLNNKLKEE